jgi:hypothetical protein
MDSLNTLKYIVNNDINGLHKYLTKKYCKSTFVVRIKETDERLGVKKGQLYIAENYWLDPGSKVTLLNRMSSTGKVYKKNPGCNQYKSDIEIVNEFKK